MEDELLSRCGYRCDLCLANKRNIEKKDLRSELSDGWEKCFGFRIPAEKIYCDGCCANDNPKLIDTKCPVRPCVNKKGLDNCSQCGKYPCKDFKQREVIYEKIVKDKKGITKSDRKLFIRPYENKQRIDTLQEKKV